MRICALSAVFVAIILQLNAAPLHQIIRLVTDPRERVGPNETVDLISLQNDSAGNPLFAVREKEPERAWPYPVTKPNLPTQAAVASYPVYKPVVSKPQIRVISKTITSQDIVERIKQVVDLWSHSSPDSSSFLYNLFINLNKLDGIVGEFTVENVSSCAAKDHVIFEVPAIFGVISVAVILRKLN